MMRRRNLHSTGVDGALVVDKPAGITSHDVVENVRRVVGTRVGHTGTLDPAATGVLVLVLGRATRLAPFLTAADKEYLAAVRLGVVTDTYDREGRVLAQNPVPDIGPTEIARMLQDFLGTVEQTVPPYSAVRVAGERLYKAARRGETPELPKRRVHIRELELVDRRTDRLVIRLVCSSGTYVRSLAHELGRKIGCGAILEELRRTRSGCFRLEQARPLECILENWKTHLLPPEELLPELPAVVLAECQVRRIRHGNPIPAEQEPRRSSALETGWVRLLHEGKLVALGRYAGDEIQPKIVISPTD
ncbi:MAG TPA: tRNA pseudouridine(55) synthase TruB [Acidobacteriota bacterium]|nr:tRNA pseudouridine(55) synthase TruB [Acidobacteriota bacterium]